MDLKDMCRTSYSNRYKKVQLICYIPYTHHGLNLYFNNNRNNRRYVNSWKPRCRIKNWFNREEEKDIKNFYSELKLKTPNTQGYGAQ